MRLCFDIGYRFWLPVSRHHLLMPQAVLQIDSNRLSREPTSRNGGYQQSPDKQNCAEFRCFLKEVLVSIFPYLFITKSIWRGYVWYVEENLPNFQGRLYPISQVLRIEIKLLWKLDRVWEMKLTGKRGCTSHCGRREAHSKGRTTKEEW